MQGFTHKQLASITRINIQCQIQEHEQDPEESSDEENAEFLMIWESCSSRNCTAKAVNKGPSSRNDLTNNPFREISKTHSRLSIHPELLRASQERDQENVSVNVNHVLHL